MVLPHALQGTVQALAPPRLQHHVASALAEAARTRVRLTQDLGDAVRDADFVSENVPEDLALKQALFGALDRLAPPRAILSTDTSSLSITAIASATGRPERVVGFHWFNPPHLMLPVEKIATPEDVDLAVQWGLGFRWAAVGPLRIMDLAGLGTFRAIAAYLFPELSAASAPQPLMEEAVAKGHLGARAGKGFYDYRPGAHEALIRERDARLVALRRVLSSRKGSP